MTTKAPTKTSNVHRLLILGFSFGYFLSGNASRSVGQAVVEWHFSIAFFALVLVDWLELES